MDEKATIVFNGSTFSLDFPKLKKWLQLESLKSKVFKSAEHKNIEEFSNTLCSYVSLCINIEEDIQDIYWKDTAFAFMDCIEANNIETELPMLNERIEELKERSWDYEGREWYLWSHILASNYGWNLEYIAELGVIDAFSLIQEHVVDDQLKKEWEWMLTELAYPYNSSSKQHEFKELPRPEWMTEEPIKQPIKKVKILKSMMPVGNIIRYDNNAEEVVN